jgi:drug/metabolite transporter (DMT)-like permease
MSLTLAGVIWVVRERQPASTIPRGHRIRGILGGVLGASGQALGLVLSKLGMAEVIDPLPATAVRMGAATIGVWILAYTTGRRAGLGVLIRHPEARLATLAATLVGPVIGVWLSLVAVRHTHAGIAATLMALTPILVVPMVILIHRERVSPRAGIGALISVAGVALLFLRG